MNMQHTIEINNEPVVLAELRDFCPLCKRRWTLTVQEPARIKFGTKWLKHKAKEIRVHKALCRFKAWRKSHV